jgi:hypothetical protein
MKVNITYPGGKGRKLVYDGPEDSSDVDYGDIVVSVWRSGRSGDINVRLAHRTNKALHMNIHEGNDTQWTLTAKLADTPDGASKS